MAHIVETTAGRIEGREKNGQLLFAGIPFAAPPVGDLRFRAPRPHPGWDGVRDATQFGKVSVQTFGMMEVLGSGSAPGQGPDWSEDCLFLNVQTPALDDARRPVLVWIHGGGFVSGTGAIPWYDGARFVEHGDVVYVSINYRLGALGWLYLGGLDDGYRSSGNNGLLDQIAALEWVRDNIERFGGDPGNVTVFGESAGGMSIGTLLGTPAAAGLFHRAIPQSGAAHNTWPADNATEVTERLCKELEVSDLAGLLAVDAQRILDAQEAVTKAITEDRATGRSGSSLGLPFGPVVGDDVLPRPPIDAIRDGQSAGVPVLTGNTREEWKLFGLMLRDVEDEETILRRLGRVVEDPRTITAAYRQEQDDASHDEVWCRIMTDRIFRIPAIRLAEAQAAHQPDNTFLYQFDWASTSFDGRLGSCHALEIPFVFDNLDKQAVELFTGPEPPQALAEAMHRSWLAFARTGDPNHDGIPDWPAYDTTNRAVLHFDAESAVRHDPSAESRAAWDGVL